MPWNNLELLSAKVKQEHRRIAAIIMKPVMCNTSVILPRSGFLEGVRDLCSRHGIVLIFDEVVTGFRVALEGAGSLFNVAPDLRSLKGHGQWVSGQLSGRSQNPDGVVCKTE